MKTIYNIQFARALAALFVVYAHIGWPGATFGHFGVDIFFVISGYIMTMLCQRSTHHFFLRRLVRIVPLYWLITLALLAVSYDKPQMLNSTTPNLVNLVKSLLFIPYIKENGEIHPLLDVGWTLNYEMYFYAAISLAGFFVAARYATLAASAAMILIVFILQLGLHFTPVAATPLGVFAQFYSTHYVPEFVFGVAAYYLTATKIAHQVGAIPAIAAALLSLLFLIYNQLEAPFGRNLPLLTQAFPALLFVVALLLLEHRNMILTKWTILGDASYALYLTNQFIVEGYRKIVATSLHVPMYSVFSCCAVLLLATLVGIVVFKFLEKPLHDKLRSLT